MSAESFEKWAADAEEMQLSNPARTQFAKMVWQASRAVAIEDCAALCEMELPQNDGISCAEAIRELGE